MKIDVPDVRKYLERALSANYEEISDISRDLNWNSGYISQERLPDQVVVPAVKNVLNTIHGLVGEQFKFSPIPNDKYANADELKKHLIWFRDYLKSNLKDLNKLLKEYRKFRKGNPRFSETPPIPVLNGISLINRYAEVVKTALSMDDFQSEQWFSTISKELDRWVEKTDLIDEKSKRRFRLFSKIPLYLQLILLVLILRIISCSFYYLGCHLKGMAKVQDSFVDSIKAYDGIWWGAKEFVGNFGNYVDGKYLYTDHFWPFLVAVGILFFFHFSKKILNHSDFSSVVKIFKIKSGFIFPVMLVLLVILSLNKLNKLKEDYFEASNLFIEKQIAMKLFNFNQAIIKIKATKNGIFYDKKTRCVAFISDDDRLTPYVTGTLPEFFFYAASGDKKIVQRVIKYGSGMVINKKSEIISKNTSSQIVKNVSRATKHSYTKNEVINLLQNVIALSKSPDKTACENDHCILYDVKNEKLFLINPKHREIQLGYGNATCSQKPVELHHSLIGSL